MTTFTAIAIILILVVYVALTQTNNLGNSQQPEKIIGDFDLVSSSPSIENGKIVVLFIGAEACPFCAAESWSLAEALQDYGSLTGLTHVISNSSEKIPNVPGYGFANASLSSARIAFWEVETTTSSWNQKLQALNYTESSFFQKFDPNGSIPFILIGGVYLHIGAGPSPEPLANMNWTEVQEQALSHTQIGTEISNEVSNITSAINYVSNHLALFKMSNESAVLWQSLLIPIQMTDQIWLKRIYKVSLLCLTVVFDQT